MNATELSGGDSAEQGTIEKGKLLREGKAEWHHVVIKQALVTQSCLPLRPHGLLCSWNSLGRNTGVGCHSILQGIFPTQGSNPGLLHGRQILYPLSHQGT